VLVSLVAPSDGGGRTESEEVVAGVPPPVGLVPPAAPAAAPVSDVSDELVPAAPRAGPELGLTGVSESVADDVEIAGSRTSRASAALPTDVCVIDTPTVVAALVVLVVESVVALMVVVALGADTVVASPVALVTAAV
jgi:hypothetical protein